MKCNASFAVLATLVIAFPGPALAAMAQECATQPPAEFTISATQERTVARSLNTRQQSQLNQIARRLGQGLSYRQIQAQWEGFASQLSGSNIDVNALVQSVLHQAYQQNQADLQLYADKVRFYNEQKEAIRGELTRMRGFKSSVDRGDRRTDFRPNMSVWRVSSDYRPPKVIRSTDPLDALISKWEEELNAVGDDAQLANNDLQNVMQKQQQAMQTMSCMSKMLHDTAMAVIRKIGH
jgi:hypothetical protein